MRIVHQRCCALDVPKRSVTACVLIWDGAQLIQERRKDPGRLHGHHADSQRVQNRIEKLLEDANLKLGSVASDTLGASSRKILRAVVAGDRDPGWMADYAQGRLRAQRQQLEEALHGLVTDHHRGLLQWRLRRNGVRKGAAGPRGAIRSQKAILASY